jgi:cytochrome c oxidase assembly protein subunit 15
MNLSFRHLAATTTVATFSLILLGVYVGAAGAGLACGAAWPFCDGWLGLFPANWPSFLEWFHRLVAMLTGFLIIGTAYTAWRTGQDRIIRYGTVIATVVLPVQILLGANTVLNFGILATLVHHTAAQIIFGALVVSTTVAFLKNGSRGGETAETASVNPSQADD